ncbi:hypothetical protein COO60DRAFT_1526237 [Scenedesmus sp. NREL 46B-D3]|nr:hypothetical protein COO60DRAFT_1526237 [Scenedesmus sp. NREL 46B-D3]
MNSSANGAVMEQMQPSLQGSGPKHMNSKGGRSKKQHHDFLAAVSSSNGGKQQEYFMAQDSQAQLQERQEPYELQKQEGVQPETAAPGEAHTIDKLPLSSTGTDNNEATAAAAGGWPGSSIPVPPLPQALLPAVNSCSELSQGQLDVLGAWYCLYCPQPEAQQAVALARRYDEKASFEDNFVKVFGREQIGVMFYVMRRATSRISMAIEKIEVLPGSTNSKHGDTYQLRIVGRHSFFFPPAIR